MLGQRLDSGLSQTYNKSRQNPLRGKYYDQKPPKCQCWSQEIPFPWFSSHYVLTVRNQVSAKVDLITFLITSEPSPDTQTLEKAQAGDVSISLVCCGAAAQVRAAVIVSRCYGRPLFLEVCVCVCVQWLW